MRRFLAFLIFGLMISASTVSAHDCCCGGMDRLSAETVKRIEQRQLEIDAEDARRQFESYGYMLNGMALDSPFYPGVKRNYEYWADRLERLQGKAIDDATWKMIETAMDEALDDAY